MLRDLPRDTLIDGRYRVISRIGSGGMADVYCAQDTQLGRNVALKLLHRRFAEDREFVERFRREASSAASLQHPNVVAVFDRGEWDGTSYIAMEFLEGRTLKQLILEEAPLDPLRAIDVAVQILRAARFAHKRGVIHRDLKPHNVMVDAEGRAKVTDFGIARAGASDMTQTGSIMGTAQYLSPEQAQGQPVTPQSDLYSIGVVLYEMLTGRVPFDGESAVTIALKQVNEAPAPPSAYNAAVTPELEAVVLQAMAKDPTQRFPDADAFILALDHCRAHLADGVGAGAGQTAAFAPVGVIADPVEPLEPLPPAERGRRWGWWLALLAVALLIAGGAAAYVLTRPAQHPVPNVTGKPVTAALALLQNAGFDPTVERTTSDAPIGRVIRQDPQPGVKAKEGSEVTLTVSDGPGTATVPDVVGQGRKAAARALRDAGFEVAARREPSDTVKAGEVVSSEPDGGSLAQVGSTVTLVVSSGPEQVAVPNVVGQSRGDARSALESAGFAVSVDQQEDDKAAPGTVLAQDPAGGAGADKGSTVTITVAKRPADVTVPDVTGQDEASAINQLTDADLVPNEVTQTVTDDKQDGIVLHQTPKGGRTARRGSRVTLTVGRFQQPTTPQQTTPTTTTTVPTTPTTPGGTP